MLFELKIWLKSIKGWEIFKDREMRKKVLGARLNNYKTFSVIKLTGHHGGGGPSEGWTPSRCCSRRECGRLQVAFRQRWGATDLGGFLPCPEFWLWHSQWCLRVRRPKWWSCQWGSLRRFAYLHEVWVPSEELTPFGCCSRKEFCRLQVACQRRWGATDLGGCLPCLESWPWHSQWCLRVQRPKWWSCQWGSWRRSACHL